MSQFMIIVGGPFNEFSHVQKIENSHEFIRTVAGQLLNAQEMAQCFEVIDIDELSMSAMSDRATHRFEETSMAKLLSQLAAKSEKMVLWYSSFWQDLDEVEWDEDTLHRIGDQVENDLESNLEFYMIIVNKLASTGGDVAESKDLCLRC